MAEVTIHHAVTVRSVRWQEYTAHHPPHRFMVHEGLDSQQVLLELTVFSGKGWLERTLKFEKKRTTGKDVHLCAHIFHKTNNSVVSWESFNFKKIY